MEDEVSHFVQSAPLRQTYWSSCERSNAVGRGGNHGVRLEDYLPYSIRQRFDSVWDFPCGMFSSVANLALSKWISQSRYFPVIYQIWFLYCECHGPPLIIVFRPGYSNFQHNAQPTGK